MLGKAIIASNEITAFDNLPFSGMMYLLKINYRQSMASRQRVECGFKFSGLRLDFILSG